MPYTAEVTVEWQFPNNGTNIHTLEPDEHITGIVMGNDGYNYCNIDYDKARANITNTKLLNVTGTEIFEFYSKSVILPDQLERANDEIEDLNSSILSLGNLIDTMRERTPNSFYGTVTSSNGVVADVEIIAVNMANHTDVTRTTTNAEGRYFIEVTEPGDYLIQAIGGGPEAYQYTANFHFGITQANLVYD